MTREEAKKIAIQITQEAIRPDNISDEDWSLFCQYAFILDEEKLADDLLKGLENGYSVDQQREMLKITCAPYKAKYNALFEEADEFAKSIKKDA